MNSATLIWSVDIPPRAGLGSPQVGRFFFSIFLLYLPERLAPSLRLTGSPKLGSATCLCDDLLALPTSGLIFGRLFKGFEALLGDDPGLKQRLKQIEGSNAKDNG